MYQPCRGGYGQGSGHVGDFRPDRRQMDEGGGSKQGELLSRIAGECRHSRRRHDDGRNRRGVPCQVVCHTGEVSAHGIRQEDDGYGHGLRQGEGMLRSASGVRHKQFQCRISIQVLRVQAVHDVHVQKGLVMSFTFYHLYPKGADVKGLGIVTPGWAYRNGRIDMFRKMTDKYRDRLCNAWGIYSGREPSSLTDKEVYDGVCKFRKSVHGMDVVYMFRYMPYSELGSNMADTLSGKGCVKIDMDSPGIKNIVNDIYWGRDMSVPEGKALDESYYRNVTETDYFSRYDDNNAMLFSTLNHIGVEVKGGVIPYNLIQEVNPMSKRMRMISLLESASVQLMGIGGIDFPMEEYESLKGKDIIITHRVSDEYAAHKAEDFVRVPWGDIYKIIYRMDIRDVKDSPFYDELTSSQKKELNKYDRIAVLFLRKNQERHIDDKGIERIYREVIADYKKHMDIDLKGVVDLEISEVPTYTEGKPAPKWIGKSAGNLVRRYRKVIINPYPEIPMKAYNVKGWNDRRKVAEFVYLICAHELAHAVDAFELVSRSQIDEDIRKAKESGFTTGYLESYGKNVPDEEIYAEWTADALLRIRNGKRR